MDARSINEAVLASHLPEFLSALGLAPVATEVKIGAFRLDAVAAERDGTLVIIEFKANASIGALGQLLLYPHALRKKLHAGGVQAPRIRSLIITTHFDSNVVEVVSGLGDQVDITVRVCIGSTKSGLKLVPPGDVGKEQVWDQSDRGTCRLDSVVACVRGAA